MLCFRKFPMTKGIMDKRGGVWGIKILRRKLFCLRVPESFVGEKFCALSQKVSGNEELCG